MGVHRIVLSKLRQVLVLGGLVLIAAACGSTVSSSGVVATTNAPSEEPTDTEEVAEIDSESDSTAADDEGASPEEEAALELQSLIAQELRISGEASVSAVVDEAFGVEVQVEVARRTQLVSVDFVLPDGVLLVGGDCGQGSGTVRCFVADEFSYLDPGELAVELVLDSGAGFVAGDVVVVEAIATNGMSEFELNELTELTPEDNVITFEILVA